MAATHGSAIILAHISDVHLTPPPVSLSWRDRVTKRGLSLISWRKNRAFKHLEHYSQAVIEDMTVAQPDLILNTGDVTNFGLPCEFERSVDWLSRLPAPSLLVPGNHDALVPEDWGKTGALWAPWMHNARPSSFPYCQEYGDVAIIGMNSAIVTPPFFAAGLTGKKQRERLTTLLGEKAGMFRVVMIHHPPRKGLVSWRKSLLDYKAVSTILAKHGVELVLHGHSHNATVSELYGTDVPLIGCASASLKTNDALRQSGWNRLEIKRQPGSWKLTLTRRSFHEASGWRDWPAQSWIIKSKTF